MKKGAGELVKESAGVQPWQNQWSEFHRALDLRNYARAAFLARRLHIEEDRVRQIELNVLKQFLTEYRNFDAASAICADYCFTIEELQRLVEEALKDKSLESEQTLVFVGGRERRVSVADQIRQFAYQEIQIIEQNLHDGSEESRWKKFAAAFKSWFDRWSWPWGGGFPSGGPAYV
jgi:hypothetical protein